MNASFLYGRDLGDRRSEHGAGFESPGGLPLHLTDAVTALGFLLPAER